MLRLLAYSQRNLGLIEETDDLEEKLELYRELDSVSPGEYSTEITDLELEIAIQADPSSLPREQRIARQFAPNGQHHKLTAMVKASMFDPDSFEHISTSALDQGERIFVKMRYRGKNRMGALTIDTEEAFFSVDGKYLQAQSGITFLDMTSRTDKYYHIVAGRVRNDGEFQIEKLIIGVDFTDGLKTVIDSGTTRVVWSSEPLAPGSARKFEVKVDKDKRILDTRYYVVEDD